MNFKSFSYHPFLVTAFQILTVYSININEVNFNTLFIVLIISLFFTGLIYFLLSIIIDNNMQAAIVVTFYGFLFFIYGRVLDILIEHPVFGLLLGRNRYVLLLYAFIVIAGTLWIFRSKWCSKNLRAITKYINMFSFGLVMVAVLTAAINFDWTIYKDIVKSTNYNINKEVYQISQNKENSFKPNIYFLIFDSYVSPRILKEYYNWEDSSLVNALIAREFSVSKNTRSNYCFSGGSIAATLNMRYIHKDQNFIDAYNQDTYIYNFYTNNEVMNRLKSEGYDILANRGNHHNWPYYNSRKPLLSEGFVQLIIHISMLRMIDMELIVAQARQDVMDLLEGLKMFGKPEKPTFLYVHIVTPHSPFVFKSDGSRLENFVSPFGRYEDINNFLEQVKFAGTQIIEIADSIRSKDEDAIIIIQSDHGIGIGSDDSIYLDRNSLAAKTDNREKPPSDYLDNRFGILSAISSPVNLGIPMDSTPVNLFRYIFNAIFDDNYTFVPDRSYFAVIKRPYYFQDITDDLDLYKIRDLE